MNASAPNIRVLSFFDYLRQHQYTIGIAEATDILATIGDDTEPNRRRAYHVMRSLTCRNHVEWLRFAQLYRRYWFPDSMAETEQESESPSVSSPQQSRRVSGIAGTTEHEAESIYGNVALKGSGAGKQNSISRADYRFLNDRHAMRQAEILAEKLADKLKRRLIRRRIIKSRGDRLEVRRTVRNNLALGGFPINRCHSVRKRAEPRLVILHDISHSMAWNNPLLFRFCRGLVRKFPDATAYAFHTRIFPVTEIYRAHSISQMREKLEASNHLWMGGTCIARSVATYNKIYAPGLLAGKTIILIISDGFDTDDRNYLRQELNTLGSRVKRILWLNPMLGREGVDIDVRALQLSFPAIDAFLPANSLYALQQAIGNISAIH